MKKIILAALVAVFSVAAFGQKSVLVPVITPACAEKMDILRYYKEASPELKASLWRGQLLIHRRDATPEQAAFLDRVYKELTPDVFAGKRTMPFSGAEYKQIVGKSPNLLDPTLISYLKTAVGSLPESLEDDPLCTCRWPQGASAECPQGEVCGTTQLWKCRESWIGCGDWWLLGCNGNCFVVGGGEV